MSHKLSKEEKNFRHVLATLKDYTDEEVIERVKALHMMEPEVMRKYADKEDFNKISKICLEQALNDLPFDELLRHLAFVLLCTDESIVFKQIKNHESRNFFHVCNFPPETKLLDAVLAEGQAIRKKKNYTNDK